MKKIVLTGDRPTGKLHLGHYVGSLANRLELQKIDDYKRYIMIADTQALSANANDPEKIHKNVTEVALDYFAIGIDPKFNTIFIQSLVPELSELTMYYLNLVTLARLEQNPTVKDEMRQKGFGSNVPIGFLAHPISQAADITAFKTEIVPVGEDQLPLIEQTNEIVRKFNYLYKTNILTECTPLLSKTPRLPGLDGKAKMSKSLNNAIYLADSPDEIERKIKSMYTDPDHIKVTGPGNVKGNVVFSYLDAFDPDKKLVEKMKKHYKQGGLGDVELKKHLNNILQNFLKPIRERREQLNKRQDEIMDILKQGSKEARIAASETLKQVKGKMFLGY